MVRHDVAVRARSLGLHRDLMHRHHATAVRLLLKRSSETGMREGSKEDLLSFIGSAGAHVPP